MVKLIASDLDGTLLTDCKELSPKTREVLDLAVQHGIYIVPATGRSFHSIPEMIRNYPGVEYVITANGGAVYSVREGKRVYQKRHMLKIRYNIWRQSMVRNTLKLPESQ